MVILSRQFCTSTILFDKRVTNIYRAAPSIGYYVFFEFLSFNLEYEKSRTYGERLDNGSFYGTINTIFKRKADLSVTPVLQTYSKFKVNFEKCTVC